MKYHTLLKTLSILAIYSLPIKADAYVKEHPISLYNIATGYFAYINNNRSDIYIYSDYTYNLRHNPGMATWFPILNDNGTYTFKNAVYGYCIEKYYQKGIVQNPCDTEKDLYGEEKIQQWSLQNLSNGAFLIKAAGNTSYCLTASGVNLEISQCDSNDPNHQWALTPPLHSDYEFPSALIPM